MPWRPPLQNGEGGWGGEDAFRRLLRLVLLSLLFLPSCGGDSRLLEPEDQATGTLYQPRHAERFRLDTTGERHILTVWPPWRDPTGPGLRYVLVPEGVEPPAGSADSDRFVNLPVERLVTTSTTEVAHLDVLQATQVLVGHSEFDYVSSPAVRARMKRGGVAEVGGGSGLHPELLLEVSPDAVLADFLAQSELDRLAPVEAGGVPIVLMPTFLEASPLGRAEWIVVTGVLLGRLDEAVAAFDEVERSYTSLAARVAETLEYESLANDTPRPRVVTGGPWDDVWHVPGGRSYTARFLADAGARYLWADDQSTGALPLDIETVYESAVEAEVWLHPSSWTSLQQITGADSRLGGFRAVNEARVYANDRRLNEHGGNDFWESGAARPNVVLADLVKIFHPELLPQHDLVYHRRLEH